MIEGRKITKKFGEKTIFSDYSFSIEDGEFVCFSGESGAGKTTLLNIIGLIEPIDEGQIIINGREYKTNREKLSYYRDEVGFLFQNFALLEDKTVKENLKLVRRGKGALNSSQFYESLENALEKVGLADKLNSKVYTLSGGEQQRIALARLFLKQCSIILADEPTGSLDEKNADLVMEILMKLHSEGKTVIMVTHDQRIKKMAERIIEL